MEQPPLGLLSQGSTRYLKKRLSLRFNYLLKSKRRTSKYPSKYLQGWGRQLNVTRGSKSKSYNQNLIRWYILTDIVLFIKKLRKIAKSKCLSRITVINQKSHKQFITVLIAIILSVLLIPFLYIFNIGLKSYQYINIYITCCLCYSGLLRYILFFILPAYAILIMIAVIFAGVELSRQIPLIISKKQNVHLILFGK